MAPFSVPAKSATRKERGTKTETEMEKQKLKADGFRVLNGINLRAVTQGRYTRGTVHGDGNGLVDVLTPLCGLGYTNWANLCFPNDFRRSFTSMAKERQKDIRWCVSTSKFWDVGIFGVAEGNEPSINYFYCAAAMLVTVPKWGEEREKIFRQVE